MSRVASPARAFSGLQEAESLEATFRKRRPASVSVPESRIPNIELRFPERNIHADIDIDISGVPGVATRNAWRSMDAKLEHGDVLVVAVLDRIWRRSLDVMGKIYDLVDRGVRLRSLADNEAWAKRLDADPQSMEWMTATRIAQVCSFSAQLDRQVSGWAGR